MGSTDIHYKRLLHGGERETGSGGGMELRCEEGGSEEGRTGGEKEKDKCVPYGNSWTVL